MLSVSDKAIVNLLACYEGVLPSLTRKKHGPKPALRGVRAGRDVSIGTRCVSRDTPVVSGAAPVNTKTRYFVALVYFATSGAFTQGSFGDNRQREALTSSIML